MSLVFDTLKLSKSLGRAFTPEQVEVLTEALTINVNESLATKADLAVTSAELKAEIAEVKADVASLDTKLTAEIASLDTKLTGKIAELDTRLTGKIAELDTRLTGKIASIEISIANTKAELIRWIVTSFLGNVVAMVTIAIAVVRLAAHP